MACPKCGQPNFLGLAILCPSCAADAEVVTDYEYNEHDDTVTCGKCKTVTEFSDARTLIEGDSTFLLWKCPTCGRVYDMGA